MNVEVTLGDDLVSRFPLAKSVLEEYGREAREAVFDQLSDNLRIMLQDSYRDADIEVSSSPLASSLSGVATDIVVWGECSDDSLEMVTMVLMDIVDLAASDLFSDAIEVQSLCQEFTSGWQAA